MVGENCATKLERSYLVVTGNRTSGLGSGRVAQRYSPPLAPLILQQHLSDLPNPATLQLEQVRPDATIVLREALGCELMRHRVSGYHNMSDIADPPEGVFKLELRTPDQCMAVERAVIQR